MMTNSSKEAGKTRQDLSIPKRLTRSKRQGIWHMELDSNKEAQTVLPKTKGRKRAKKEDSFWTVQEHVVIISDEPEEPIESDPTEPTWDEAPPGFEKQNHQVQQNWEDEEATSAYTPAEYPVFPPLYYGPDEHEPYSWTLFSPASRRVRCAMDPEPLPTDLPEPVIVLRGYDTMRPGSPQYLPEEIPISKWWQDSQDLGIGLPKPYLKMVKYAEATYHERVPARDGGRSRAKRSEKEVLEWFSALPMPK